MVEVKCDICGEVVNKPYYDAGACETFNNSPYEIILKEGTTYEGEQCCPDRKDYRWELCENCFVKVKKAIKGCFT